MKNWSILRKKGRTISVCLVVFFICLAPDIASASGAPGEPTLLFSISISILAATICACVAYLLKQPLILAYIAAGVAIGPNMGFALIHNKSDIETISEIGLILLLFMIGLELDLKKLRKAGKSLILTGVLQFIICASLGFGFFLLLGFSLRGQAPFTYDILGVKVLGGPYDLPYLAACIALSSTTIVVKLLYEKFELDTLAGRLTLGVLVFQDLWAIVLLSVQPNLAHPDVAIIFLSFAKGALLVLVSLLMSKYVLGALFRTIAKVPEIMLVASLGWCFFIAGLAHYLGLSLEMGALIAGVALSTFPYSIDIIGKIINIRDFFITLFFVALGMMIPNPLANPGLLLIAALTALFLVATRFLSVYPLLFFLGNGNRVSLLATINLSQISEFALVIAVIGVKSESRHIGPDIVTIIIFVFVLTSIASTYMIQYSHGLQNFLRKGLEKLGFRALHREPLEDRQAQPPDLALLGFFRVASSFLTEVEDLKPRWTNRLVVVDFNPEVFTRLSTRGVKIVYGDIGNMHTLQHAGLEHARVVVSTITDDILVGTNNLKLLSQLRSLCPEARIVVTAASPTQALQLYEAGADYVLRPNFLTATHLISVLDHLFREDMEVVRKEEMQKLSQRREVLD